MRGVLQRVVELVQGAVFHGADFLADADHRCAEAVQFFLGLTLGRLDHQRASHREGHGRGMEAEVDQALGHVLDADAAAVLERAQVEDALVGDQSVLAGVQHRVVFLQAAGDVVGTEDRQLRGALEPFPAHHADVHPGDRQDAGTAIRRRADRALRVRQMGVTGQERRQVRLDANRADTGAATAVGNTEGLVQVQVRHVATELARGAQADHGVHVGAIQVHLAAVLVNDVADAGDGIFEHAVGRGVGDHQRSQLRPVLLGLELQVGDIDVATLVAVDHHHPHAGHLRRGRVGAMGRRRDQAYIAPCLATAGVVGADRQQAGILTLGTGIGLQRHGVIAGGRAEHGLQFIGQLAVTLRLLSRGEWVQGAELGPGDRDHLAGGIELHGARAERDHAAVQGQVLVGQAAQVAHQFGFAMVAVEHRV
ncbi:hypothetical protein D3C81_640150 [compost metagenome]